jgi:hypothetical protein
MKTKCVLCEREIRDGGFSRKINNVRLDPLCIACDRRCSADAQSVVTEYGWLFDPRMPKPKRAHPISGQASQTTPEGSSASQRIDEQIRAVNGDYLVIPFIGKIKSGFLSSENAETVSRQLQSLISQYSQQGWEFQNIAKINIEVSPGCLASLFGATTSYVTFDQVVFRRARQ